MKRAIVGSRKWMNRIAVFDYVWSLDMSTIIISGGAAGVDSWAEMAAKQRHMPDPVIYKPDYEKYPPNRAPLMRNSRIVKECDALTAFWDGVSRGTVDALNKAAAMQKPITLFVPNFECLSHFDRRKNRFACCLRLVANEVSPK